jgi:hypothetical protein
MTAYLSSVSTGSGWSRTVVRNMATAETVVATGGMADTFATVCATAASTSALRKGGMRNDQ